MSTNNPPWKKPSFIPHDTLANAPDPTLTAHDADSSKRPPLQSMQSNERTSLTHDAPTFGQPSPLRNKLKQPSIFNVPDRRKGRVEHHRPKQSQSNNAAGLEFPGGGQWPQSGLRMAQQHKSPSQTLTADFFEETRGASQTGFEFPATLGARAPVVAGQFQRPGEVAYRDTKAVARPVFSSKAGYGGVRTEVGQKGREVERKGETGEDEEDGEEDRFDVNQAFADDRFGDYDPLNYVESVQAQKDILALLEGAIEEDAEDRPKVNLRKRRVQVAAKQPKSLSEKLQALEVSSSQESESQTPEEEVDDGSVEGLNIKLLPHQIDGVAWMLDKEIGERKKNGVLPNGGILADDMGLGKTIQALSLILTNPKPDRVEDTAIGQKGKKKRNIPADVTKCTLVVAPLALIKQWESEIKTKVLPSAKLKVLVHHGQSRTKSAEDLKKYDVVITTYQTLSSEHAASPVDETKPKLGCMGVCWWRVILDEAHSIKNRNAKMTKAAYNLRAVYRWCLTGTPMQNNLDELQSLIRFLQIKPYMMLAKWQEDIGVPMKNGRGGIAMRRLQFFLKSFMKRRTKDVLKKEGGLNFGKDQDSENKDGKQGFQIVKRDVQTIEVEFTEQERQVYDGFEARTGRSLEQLMNSAKQNYLGALVLLLRMRQLCNHRRLVRYDVSSESDVIDPPTVETPLRKTKSGVVDDMDEVAALIGGLTVEAKSCDICRTKLNKDNASADGMRCTDCDADLRSADEAEDSALQNSQVTRTKDHIRNQKKKTQHRRVIESDDEDVDEEGEWLVPEDQRRSTHLGKAGGTDDEDAEGGGESLGEEDSDTEDEDSTSSSESGDDSEDDSEDDSKDAEDDSDDEAPISRRLNLTPHKRHHKPKTYTNTRSLSPPVPCTTGILPSAKISTLLRILRAESRTHKFIVFSEFTSMLDIIEPFLRDANFRFTRYDGSMKNDEREASLERLRNDRKTRILLCSLRCGSLGLNLTAASRVVILEPFWNPFVEEQAIDRVHRLNQTKDVVVYKLTVARTVEERIIALQEKKRELAKAAIEGGAQAIGKLTMQDILKLFKRDAEEVRYTGSRAVNGGARAASRPVDGGVYGRRWY